MKRLDQSDISRLVAILAALQEWSNSEHRRNFASMLVYETPSCDIILGDTDLSGAPNSSATALVLSLTRAGEYVNGKSYLAHFLAALKDRLTNHEDQDWLAHLLLPEVIAEMASPSKNTFNDTVLVGVDAADDLIRSCEKSIAYRLKQKDRIFHLSGHRFSDKESIVERFANVLLPTYLKGVVKDASVHITRLQCGSLNPKDVASYETALRFLAKHLLGSLRDDDIQCSANADIQDGVLLKKEIVNVLNARLISNKQEYFVFIVEDIEYFMGKNYILPLFSAVMVLNSNEPPLNRFFLMTTRACESFHLHFKAGESDFLKAGPHIDVDVFDRDRSLFYLKQLGINDDQVMDRLHLLVGGSPVLLREMAIQYLVGFGVAAGKLAASKKGNIQSFTEEFFGNNEMLGTCSIKDQVFKVARFLDATGLWDTFDMFRDSDCVSVNCDPETMNILQKVGIVEQRRNDDIPGNYLSGKIWKLLFSCTRRSIL